MKLNIIIILLCFVFLAIISARYDIALILSAFIFGLIISNNFEYLDVLKPISNKERGDDNYEHSKYGNISVKDDIDSFKQRSADLDLDDDGEIDNQNIVKSFLSGSSNFQPNNASGISTTSSAYHSHFKLAEPNPNLESALYSVPLNETGYNLDQALARKQQHRSSLNKRAIDGVVRSTKNIFAKYFTNELRENEEREWWSNEADPVDYDFNLTR